jgi:hypothetical protein
VPEQQSNATRWSILLCNEFNHAEVSTHWNNTWFKTNFHLQTILICNAYFSTVSIPFYAAHDRFGSIVDHFFVPTSCCHLWVRNKLLLLQLSSQIFFAVYKSYTIGQFVNTDCCARNVIICEHIHALTLVEKMRYIYIKKNHQFTSNPNHDWIEHTAMLIQVWMKNEFCH